MAELIVEVFLGITPLFQHTADDFIQLICAKNDALCTNTIKNARGSRSRKLEQGSALHHLLFQFVRGKHIALGTGRGLGKHLHHRQGCLVVCGQRGRMVQGGRLVGAWR